MAGGMAGGCGKGIFLKDNLWQGAKDSLDFFKELLMILIYNVVELI